MLFSNVKKLILQEFWKENRTFIKQNEVSGRLKLDSLQWNNGITILTTFLNNKFCLWKIMNICEIELRNYLKTDIQVNR